MSGVQTPAKTLAKFLKLVLNLVLAAIVSCNWTIWHFFFQNVCIETDFFQPIRDKNVITPYEVTSSNNSCLKALWHLQIAYEGAFWFSCNMTFCSPQTFFGMGFRQYTRQSPIKGVRPSPYATGVPNSLSRHYHLTHVNRWSDYVGYRIETAKKLAGWSQISTLRSLFNELACLT